MDSGETENEPIKNNESAYRQEVYKRKQELDESRNIENRDQGFNKNF